MSNDKKIDYETRESITVHRLLGRVPELQHKYGFWIINGSGNICSSMDSFYGCMPRRFEFYSLSHLYQGGGRFWMPETGELRLHPGEMILVAPGAIHRYGGADGCEYIEDSIRFCGPVADRLVEAGVIETGVVPFGPVRRLLPIIEQVQDPSADAQINANIALQQLLVELYNERRRRRPRTSTLEELIDEIKAHPGHWWTVEELAEMCVLSVDQLRRNFVRSTGMRPKEYIEELKLRQAAKLLVTTNEPVASVAARFGYRDPYHFSRRFKQRIGVSPERYRKEYLPPLS